MTSLAAAIIATSSVLGQITDEEVKHQMKAFQPMVGRWFMDDTPSPGDFPELGLKKGDSVKRFSILKGEVFNSVITFDIVLDVKGRPPQLVWRDSIAWDPAAKALKSTAIGYTKEQKTRYVYAKGEWKSVGKALTVTYTGVMGDGNETSWKATFTVTDDDRLSVKITDRVRGNQRLDNESSEYQRVRE